MIHGLRSKNRTSQDSPYDPRIPGILGYITTYCMVYKYSDRNKGQKLVGRFFR